MHLILAIFALWGLYLIAKYFPGFFMLLALFCGVVFYFGFIKNPQGNLSPQMITKLGLEKTPALDVPGDPYCWEYDGKFTNPACDPKNRPLPILTRPPKISDGPVASKPLPAPRKVN